MKLAYIVLIMFFISVSVIAATGKPASPGYLGVDVVKSIEEIRE